jgi:hypothetical protein
MPTIARDLFEDESGEVVRKPHMPTHYPPASEAKMRVMMARVKARVSLFHPDDGVFSDADAKTIRMISLRELKEEI